MADRDLWDERRRSYESEYFQRRERELIEKMRARARELAEEHQMGQATGISDDDVLAALHDLGYTRETVTLVHLVPLLQVAWIDGSVSAPERAGILEEEPEALLRQRAVQEEADLPRLERRQDPGDRRRTPADEERHRLEALAPRLERAPRDPVGPPVERLEGERLPGCPERHAERIPIDLLLEAGLDGPFEVLLAPGRGGNGRRLHQISGVECHGTSRRPRNASIALKAMPRSEVTASAA